MKIISANLNGIRSAQNKGFEWLSQVDADIICLQEPRQIWSVIPVELLNFAGYHCEFHPAEKKGYNWRCHNGKN